MPRVRESQGRTTGAAACRSSSGIRGGSVVRLAVLHRADAAGRRRERRDEPQRGRLVMQEARLRDEVAQGIADVGHLDHRGLGVAGIAVEQHHGGDVQLDIRKRLKPESRGRDLSLRSARLFDHRQRLAVGPDPAVVIDRDRLIGDIAVDGAERARRGRLASARGPDQHHDGAVGCRDARGVQHPCASARGFDRGEGHLLRKAREHLRPAAAHRNDRIDRLARRGRPCIDGGVRPCLANRSLVALIQTAEVDRDTRADRVDEKSSGHTGSVRGTCCRAVTAPEPTGSAGRRVESGCRPIGGL